MKPIHLLIVLTLPVLAHAQPAGYPPERLQDFPNVRHSSEVHSPERDLWREWLRRQSRSRDHRVEPFVPCLGSALVKQDEELAGGDACHGRGALPGSSCRHRIPALPEGICPICREPRPVPSAGSTLT